MNIPLPSLQQVTEGDFHHTLFSITNVTICKGKHPIKYTF